MNLIPTSGFDTPMLASREKYFAYFIPRELAPRFLIKCFLVLLLLVSAISARSQDTLFYNSGKIKAHGKIQENQKQGLWTFYFPKGEKNALLSYVNGKLHGMQYCYHENSTLKSQETWVDDLQEDSAFHYYDNGQLEKKGRYESSLYIGTWQFYYENGNSKRVGEYDSGLPTGTWTFNHENGEIDQTGEMANGKQSGLWKYYDEQGNRTYEGYFKDDQKIGVWYYFSKSGKKKKWKSFD